MTIVEMRVSRSTHVVDLAQSILQVALNEHFQISVVLQAVGAEAVTIAVRALAMRSLRQVLALHRVRADLSTSLGVTESADARKVVILSISFVPAPPLRVSRLTSPIKLRATIVDKLQQFGYIEVQAVGAGAIGQAVRGIGYAQEEIARSGLLSSFTCSFLDLPDSTDVVAVRFDVWTFTRIYS